MNHKKENKNPVPLFVLLILLAIPVAGHADEVLMAGAEDLDAFDQLIDETGNQEQEQNKERKQNFGSIISEEAKTLKNELKDSGSNFGKHVSEKRHQMLQEKHQERENFMRGKSEREFSPHEQAGRSKDNPGNSGKSNRSNKGKNQ